MITEKQRRQNKERQEKFILNNPDYHKKYYLKNKERINLRIKSKENIVKRRRWKNNWDKEYRNRNREIIRLRANARKTIKPKLIKERGFLCERCGIIPDKLSSLHVHHIKYINDKKFLILLCRKCHSFIHKL